MILGGRVGIDNKRGRGKASLISSKALDILELGKVSLSQRWLI
jgi:hypothetical protein